MRIGFTILMLFSLVPAFGQYPINKYVVDTIHLGSFKEQKVAVYEINSVSICIKYEDYKKALYKILQSFSKNIEKETNAYIISTQKSLDSLYKQNETDVQVYDTIRISQKTFDKLVLRSIIDFDKHIESNSCAIFDEENIRQYLIVRETGSWSKQFDMGWGGRKYYLPNHKDLFFLVVDWMA